MISDLFSKFGRVTYMAIFDCEWHSLTENVSNTFDSLPGFIYRDFVGGLSDFLSVFRSYEEIVANDKCH